MVLTKIKFVSKLNGENLTVDCYPITKEQQKKDTQI